MAVGGKRNGRRRRNREESREEAPDSALSVENEQADAGRDGRTRLERPNSQTRTGTEKHFHFPCSADHEQDWQPYPVNVYSAMYQVCVVTLIARVLINRVRFANPARGQLNKENEHFLVRVRV